jgi:ribosomal protein S18 acetylase RimI-like enzyme
MITYREYQKSDWDAICNIHDRARPDELKGSCDPRAFIPIQQDPEVEGLKRSRKFVACDGDRVVGFVALDEKYVSFLYVDPDYYGRGLGRNLLQIAGDTIGEGAWTIVLDGNRRAISLYESGGYREVRRFASDNAGYPCTCLRMERSASFNGRKEQSL